jgi:Ca2+-binding EF-hand superfamily protein
MNELDQKCRKGMAELEIFWAWLYNEIEDITELKINSGLNIINHFIDFYKNEGHVHNDRQLLYQYFKRYDRDSKGILDIYKQYKKITKSLDNDKEFQEIRKEMYKEYNL